MTEGGCVLSDIKNQESKNQKPKIKIMNYESYQNQNDKEYRSEYAAWVNGLSEKQQQALIERGLSQPHIETRGAGAPELDQDRLADNHWMPGVDCDDIGEEGAGTGEGIHLDGAAEFPPGRESLQDSLRIMVAELFESKKPQYTIAVIGVGLRVFAEGRGLPSRIAEQHSKPQREVRKSATLMMEKLRISSDEDRRALRRLAGELWSSTNARLSLEILAVVSGVCYQGLSQTSIAARHKVTRAAVSKRCVEMTVKLGLPPSRAMKGESTRKTYADSQRFPLCKKDGMRTFRRHDGSHQCEHCGNVNSK